LGSGGGRKQRRSDGERERARHRRDEAFVSFSARPLPWRRTKMIMARHQSLFWFIAGGRAVSDKKIRYLSHRVGVSRRYDGRVDASNSNEELNR
jgi:hypothetical protein